MTVFSSEAAAGVCKAVAQEQQLRCDRARLQPGLLGHDIRHAEVCQHSSSTHLAASNSHHFVQLGPWDYGYSFSRHRRPQQY
jgi:hypothetical protein